MVAYAERNDGIIFPDMIMDDGKEKKIYRYREFDPTQVVAHMSYPGSSILVPRKVVEAVLKSQGGWDSQIPGMEDWDYQIAMHANGFCAFHVPEPLFVYRMATSTKREKDYAKIDSIRAYLDAKWIKYRKGEEKMCGCSGTQNTNTMPASMMSSSGNFDQQNVANQITEQMVQVQYVGPEEGTFSINSIVDRSIVYRFNNTDRAEKTVFLKDAERLNGIVDGNNNPLWRILGKATTMENRDPSAFLGQPVAI
jgi:hypothetical protein